MFLEQINYKKKQKQQKKSIFKTWFQETIFVKLSGCVFHLNGLLASRATTEGKLHSKFSSVLILISINLEIFHSIHLNISLTDVRHFSNLLTWLRFLFEWVVSFLGNNREPAAFPIHICSDLHILNLLYFPPNLLKIYP